MHLTGRNHKDFATELPRVIVIAGPTASGKSHLAESVAEICHGEIVNADSMQIYKGMNIGTAKPSQESMQRIRHQLFDIAAPDEEFTAADYSSLGKEVILDISSRGKTAIVTGGTGLYIRALLSGIVDAPGADHAARIEYNKIADRYGNEELLALLGRVDPVSAARIHPNNRVRIIRALEVFKQTGRTISAFQDEHGFLLKWCNSLKIGINVERSELYERINARVELMIAAGLVAEVESLLAQGFSPELKSLSSIGYKEICDYLAGKHSYTEAVRLIKQNSRHYAKRQLTWFNRDPEVIWYDHPVNIEDVIANIQDVTRESELAGQSHREH